ncbi:MAG TPA: PucR family transcriptional regulator ligand-binding domain-containing protein [Actinomycetota bacterium]|nr:PucR family transcriptional regulator ligand-binding domain-containing protein [Actinomycetota bacterium]
MTVRDLLALPGLGLTVVAGEAGLDRPIRWAHTSELQDPTPWLSGGELLLTTGMGLTGSAALQRSYIRRLISAGLAGLGFGVGFGADEVPAAIKRAADAEGFPVVEVPYPVPFIAIAEAVSSALAEDRLREARLSVEVHERLAALVSSGGGPADVLEEAVAIAGGWAVLFDMRGGVLARAAARTAAPPDEAKLWKSLPRPGDSATTAADQGPDSSYVALAVDAGGRREAWAVFGKGHRIEPRDRIVARHAVTVLGLLLTSRRAVVDAERRIAGDVLVEAVAGRLAGGELARRLELVGFARGEPVVALVLDAGSVSESALEEVAWLVDGALGVRQVPGRTATVEGRVVALVTSPDPERLAGLLLEEARSWALASSDVRIGVGSRSPAAELRRSYLEALFALRAAGPGVSVASPRDLGSYAVLLGGQPREALEGFVRSVLGPLIDRDRARSSDLVASVRAFIESGGRWEPGAETLAIHRHTLRYRVRQAEELLGRDLASAEDRMEIWLALKAMEVLER